MKLVLTITAILASTLLPSRASAQESPEASRLPPPLPEAYRSWSAEDLYKEGEQLLRRGRRFDRAIALLSRAVEMRSQNDSYKIALGSACAARAHSLSRALGQMLYLPTQQKVYERSLANWRAGQNDATSPLYKTPSPTPPLVPKTQDDNLELKLSPEATAQRIRDLSDQARKALGEGLDQMSDAPSAQRAEMTNRAGWALLLLWVQPRRVVPDSWPKEDSPEKIADLLESAAALQPDNPWYTQSLGDACLLAAVDERIPPEHKKQTSQELYRRGLQALRQAREAQKKNGGLALRIALAEMRLRLPEAEASLRKAIAANPANALPRYLLIGFQQAEAALGSLKAANSAGQVSWRVYKIAAPRWFGWLATEETFYGEINAGLVPVMIHLPGAFDAFVKSSDLPSAFSLAQNMLAAERKFLYSLSSNSGTDEIGLLVISEAIMRTCADMARQLSSLAPQDPAIARFDQAVQEVKKKYDERFAYYLKLDGR